MVWLGFLGFLLGFVVFWGLKEGLNNVFLFSRGLIGVPRVLSIVFFRV